MAVLALYARLLPKWGRLNPRWDDSAGPNLKNDLSLTDSVRLRLLLKMFFIIFHPKSEATPQNRGNFIQFVHLRLLHMLSFSF